VLDVVENDQQPPSAQPRHDALAQRCRVAVVDPGAGAHPAQHQRRVAQRGEVHERDAVRERLACLPRSLDRDAGLADPARAGQRQQLRVATS
jgi:hypothetical protein